MQVIDPFYRELGAFLEPTREETALLTRVLDRRRECAAGEIRRRSIPTNSPRASETSADAPVPRFDLCFYLR